MTFSLFMPAIAEITLAASSLLLVVLGAFSKPSRANLWSRVAMGALVAAVYIAVRNYTLPTGAFSQMFIQDNMALTFKGIIALGSFVGIWFAIPYFAKRGESKFEYPLIVLLATTGMFGMVSAQDFLSLYVSLELQSLSLYILASFRRDQRINSEAGLKYFFLGALSSGVLLYGISLLYGYAGSTSYLALANTFAAQETLNPGVIVGLVLVLSGLAFKISAVPFHMWTPDVYQGAPMPVTALFAMAPKAAAIGVFCRLVTGPFAPVFAEAQQILILLSIASMAVGAFAAIAQKNIKRLFAYSSIGHIGFVVLALAVGGTEGVKAALFYTAIYVIMSAGAFAILLSVYSDKDGEEDITLLAGLAKRSPVLAASFAVLLLSMAGIPPMAGFFAKLYVFTAAVQANLTWVVVLGVLFSVVSAYYYLRLIKIMYFDAAAKDVGALQCACGYKFVAVASALLMIGLLVYPAPLSNLVDWATAGIVAVEK